MVKFSGRLGSLNLVWKPVLEIENFNFKPDKLLFKLTLCHILLVAKGLGKIKVRKQNIE